MKGLMRKVRENKKGFTLAELLVVVAIVGILVAISMPVFTAQLGKARKATNNANLRAAKAAAVAAFLTQEEKDSVTYHYETGLGTAEPITGDIPTSHNKEVTIDGNDVSEKFTYDDIYVEISGGVTGTDNTVESAEVSFYVKASK